ncbi:MAG: DNA-methyltransferase [Ruminococcus sp.]
MTQHKMFTANSNKMDFIAAGSVNLIVTSPPYPMIEMWDDLFVSQDSSIKEDLEEGRGYDSFNKMHSLLNNTWKECDRVLAEHGFICINIGDATRTLNGEFQLYSNHSKIIEFFSSLGYSVLPDILWRKPSNSPNKFMGSGMYPAGAYVTYEHEYILIFRKGGKRIFKGKEKEYRQKSAYFWEERNLWFSDLWEIKGASQVLNNVAVRNRNASFPFEIPYRLVNMYSAESDTVLDPFCGLGTTNLACMASNRNSIGVEINSEIMQIAIKRLNISKNELNDIIDSRIDKHLQFIESLSIEKKEKCYLNIPHQFLVKTKQETLINLTKISRIEQTATNTICY